jgi:DNA-binding CsgD family transcriptional regulator
VRVQAGADYPGANRPGAVALLEREQALRAIDAVLAAAAAGEGRALMLTGHAGMGKTRLHDAAVKGARDRKLRVVRAAGAELEQNLAFGVAGQLLRSLLQEVSADQRRALLADASRRVLMLEQVDPAQDEDPVDDHLAVSHGLFTVLAAAVESSPAVVAVDDLQWCDTASLELILYLLHRLDELQVAVIMTQRPAGDEAANEALIHIAAHPKVRVDQLSPLGADGVGVLLRSELGDRVDASLIEVCREVTGGNPFYLHALLRALAEEGELSASDLARRARSLVPEAVARSLRVRVGRVGRQSAALARAVAVLGDDVPLRHAAILADLSIAQASRAADALASAGILLAQEPLRFFHPLVRQAIEQDIPASERAGRHLDAARLLYTEGAGVERVAAHLLLGRAEGNAWVVERLRAAAREARISAAPQSAVRYLERALAEPPAREDRAEVLGELGAAEAALGLADAAEHLGAAIRDTADPRRRAELALELGRSYTGRGEHAAAADAFGQGLREIEALEPNLGADDRELRDQLEAGFITTGTIVPTLRPLIAEETSRWLAEASATPATQGQRLLLAHSALEAAHRGEPAAEIIELAERAWDGGRILKQAAPQWIGWRIVVNALISAGALEHAAEIAEAAIHDARRRGSPLGFATASFIRSIARLLQGRVNDALADLESARGSRRFGWRQFVRAAAAQYSLCLVEAEQLDLAEAALSEDAPLEEPYDLEDAMRLYALAELRRSQRRPEEALTAALAAGRAAEQSMPFFDYCRWRASAAEAALALGDREQALALAREMLERAERTQVPHQRIEALRIAGICEGGDGGLERLRAAAELARSTPPRLETISALIELGAALRRANERAASRLPLQEAADLARQGGALRLYRRARTELAASGARPRREALLSGPESLTPSERRIAELAAGGQSNREIASTLFVTPKTVEYHLRNAYRKLDIQTRGELAEALSS